MASISATDQLVNIKKVMTRSMTIAAASGWEWKGQYPSPMGANGIILRNHSYREQGFARFNFICYPLGPQPVSPVNWRERGRRIRSMKLARQSGYRDLLWDKEVCPDWERAHFDGKTDKVVTICTRFPSSVQTSRCAADRPDPTNYDTLSVDALGYHHLSNVAQHLPKLDIEPNGPLRLLNMILDPKDPCNDKKTISTHDPRIAFNTTVSELPNMDTSERLLTRGASNVQHPEIYGRGDAVSLDCFCRSLKITTVNDESIPESIRTRAAEPRVSEALEDIHSNPASRPLYIITGIKVATGGTMDSVWRQWPDSKARMGHGNYPEDEVKNITAVPGSKTLEVREHSDYVDFRTVVDLLQDMGRVEAPLVQTE
ncbi:hypothetical protein BDQ94DRAFT_162364 [Aspergillus welwitschiae]|uniref:Uncharacterized protein n=1 Tax=Aspergillus welwitschiae TaxID=1341132 RepID=A0A3F3PQD0_9EURO|nr:hypothetical protein BDQ94DRAFT_162364 [Aspergillus welwitschiae]RDH28952.1 hypothetical protein BDQ94DRAFT_162364 [Aspergillus welwitschiae]